MKKISIMHKIRRNSDFQVFVSQFTEAFISDTGCQYTTHKFSHFVRAIMGRLLPILPIVRAKNMKAFLIPCCGIGLATESMPLGLTHEIIPMLWDCWPHNQDRLVTVMKKLKCKVVIVTSKQVREIFSSRLPDVHVIYIPEGIDIKDYNMGERL